MLPLSNTRSMNVSSIHSLSLHGIQETFMYLGVAQHIHGMNNLVTCMKVIYKVLKMQSLLPFSEYFSNTELCNFELVLNVSTKFTHSLFHNAQIGNKNVRK